MDEREYLFHVLMDWQNRTGQFADDSDQRKRWANAHLDFFAHELAEEIRKACLESWHGSIFSQCWCDDMADLIDPEVED